MRIGIMQLWQETNTFNPLPTTRRDFEAFGVLRGKEIIDQLSGTNELGGFIRSLRAWPEQPEIVGLVRLPAWPSGRATAETFAWIVDEIERALDGAGRLDGLLFALHGALAADEHPDVEGEVLSVVRRHLGAGIPLVATFDLHANLTQQMVAQADALVGFHTAPHVDVLETGVRGAAVLRRILIEGAKPTTALVKIPMVVPAERANTQDPASISYEFRRRLQALEQRPDVLTAALATVQPWLDVPELGTAVIVTTDNNQALAEHEAAALAGDVWNHRRDYLPELVSAQEGVRRAAECTAGLVVLSDAADATTSGAPGDSTWCLRELLKYPWPHGGALVTLVAPEIVAQALRLGPNAPISALLGGRRDALHSQPVSVDAIVEHAFEASFVLSGHLGVNLAIDMGRAVVLRAGDVRIVCTERSGPHFAPELFQAAGIDPFQAQVLIAKSPCGFRAVYAARSALILNVRAPGCAPSDFQNYPYHHRPHPLWPWEEFSWEAPRLEPGRGASQ
jgi:microcystin degradation protein MlrC